MPHYRFPPGSLHIGDDRLLWASLSSWGLFAVGETLLQNFTAHFGYGRRGLAA
jgi:hypothetical protein